MKLFEELKRRNVFRVAGVYAVIAWLLIQIVVAVKAPLHLPAWTDTLVIVLFAIGFPIALVLAWAFEMTPEGVKLTADVAQGESIAPRTGRKLDYAILGGLALVAAMFVYDRVTPSSLQPPTSSAPQDEGSAKALPRDEGSAKASPHPEERGGEARLEGSTDASIAVLPFLDLSPDGDQEYFSDGISEEILNVLVRIPKLKVAGRTSSFSFKGKNEDLRVIGDTLGVDHVLEGSVRKSGAKLRITAQLIRSSDGFHIWSETYDRELTDVFAIQDDIAKSVATELAASLGLQRAKAPEAARTEDIAAYEAFLKAKDLYRKRGIANLRRAQELLTEAVARDPAYAEAWAQLAAVHSVMPSWMERDEDWPAAFRQLTETGAAAAERAIALAPENAQALASRGVLLSYKGDLVGAFKSLDAAMEKDPNPEVLDSFAQNANQAGYFTEGEAAARRAVEADPLNAVFLNTLGWSLAGQDKFDEAIAAFERSIAANPQNPYPFLNELRAWLAKGEPAGAARLIRRVARKSPGYASDADEAEAFARRLDQLASGAASGDDFLEDPDFGGLKMSLTYYVKDKALAAATAHAFFIQPAETEILILGAPPAFHDDPVWKKAVKDAGLLALWRARGFPAWCKPVGDDDFACAAPAP